VFKKVLVANRGEIAVRIIRACRDLGVATVAVYSDADRGALHVRFADEAYRLGPAPSSESYLKVGAIVDVARRTGADAVHPGYGFLSENPHFADACAAAGVAFVGPPPRAMRALGEKTAARRLARDAGVPTVAGLMQATTEASQLRQDAAAIGLPVVLKAAAGGGGKGMRVVQDERELDGAIRNAMGEAASAFGDASLYLERYVAQARHIEVQFVADGRGGIAWLGERDCSLQRRHQKLIEESPGPSVDERLREQLGEAAVRLARASRYVNAGTAEFLVDVNGAFYFLEVNARLQVEHPVTEAVTGIDLVALQLRIAAGEPLPFTQDDIVRRGHAIECRISAEDPERGFVPSAGLIPFVREPAGPGIRVDSALYPGAVVPTEYDPLLAKLIAHGRDRAEAIARMRRALRETVVAGVRTTIPFHEFALAEPHFVRGAYDTEYVAAHWPSPTPAQPSDGVAAAAVVATLARRRHAEPSTTDASTWRRSGREDALR
jgi:acetyl-CoA carboxylase biotin carboxylase subunit